MPCVISIVLWRPQSHCLLNTLR